MIARVWHGWTNPENADQYETLLREYILPDIAARDISGYHGSEVYRRIRSAEVEFMTILWFDSMDAVRTFAGDDVERAHVPESAQRLLERFEERAGHYEQRFEVKEEGWDRESA